MLSNFGQEHQDRSTPSNHGLSIHSNEPKASGGKSSQNEVGEGRRTKLALVKQHSQVGSLHTTSSKTDPICARKSANPKSSQLLKFYLGALVLPCLISMWYITGTFFPPDARDKTPLLLWSQGFMRRNEKGQFEVCPYAAICAQGLVQLILIGISRLTAFASYAVVALTFVSKMHSLIHCLSSTYLSTIVPFESLHDVHKTSGKIFAWLALLHSIAHNLRYILRHDTEQIRSQVYISGLIAILLVGFISLSMSSFMKTRLSFEMRLNTHWLFVILVAVLAFHTKRTRIVVMTIFCLWLLDYLYGIFFRTYRLEFVEFTPIVDNAGTQMLWRNPEGFNVKSGEYVQIKLPWLTRGNEWHPFSVYLREATQEGLSEVHCNDFGDSWTGSMSSTSFNKVSLLELEEGDTESLQHFIQRVVDSDIGNIGNVSEDRPDAVEQGHDCQSRIPSERDHIKQYSTTQVFISPVGDWSKELFDQVKSTKHLRSCSCWVRGPYTSPYFIAHNFNHLVLTASGIGITPALGVMGQYQGNTRTKVLIWSTRSKTMLKFFAPLLKDAHLSIVYYTNKNDVLTKREMSKIQCYGNIFIEQSRPESLTVIIEYIIMTFENGMRPTIKCIRDLMRVDATHRAAWCVLYCGGSVQIRDQLHQFTKDKGIGWECELFNW